MRGSAFIISCLAPLHDRIPRERDRYDTAHWESSGRVFRAVIPNWLARLIFG